METIQIKCPCCGAVLKVKMQQGIEGKSVICPVCRQKSPFAAFGRPSGKNDDDRTVYPGKVSANAGAGVLVKPDTGERFALKEGRNVIGRRSSASSSGIQIPLPNEMKRMSREHLIIDVRDVPGRGIVHYASLYKEKVNPTAVNGEPLAFGESVVLNDGDRLSLPDADLLFRFSGE